MHCVILSSDKLPPASVPSVRTRSLASCFVYHCIIIRHTITQAKPAIPNAVRQHIYLSLLGQHSMSIHTLCICNWVGLWCHRWGGCDSLRIGRRTTVLACSIFHPFRGLVLQMCANVKWSARSRPFPPVPRSFPSTRERARSGGCVL